MTQEKGIVVGSVVTFIGYADEVSDDQNVFTVGENLIIESLLQKEKDGVPAEYKVRSNRMDDKNPDVSNALYADEFKIFEGGDKEVTKEPVVVEGKATEKKEKKKPVLPTDEEIGTEAKKAIKASKESSKKKESPKEKKPEKKVVKTNKKASKGISVKKETPKTITQTNTSVVQSGVFTPESNLIQYTKDLIKTKGGLEAAEQIKRVEVSNYYILGGVLSHIRANKEYGKIGYDVNTDGAKGGFSEYVKNTLGLEYRKAMYLADIYDTFTPLGEIFVDKLVNIGWSFAKEIVQASKLKKVNNEDIMALLEYAGEEGVRREDLHDKIKEEFDDGSNKDPAVKLTTITTKVFQDKGEVIKDALKDCREIHGVDNDDEAMFFITQEWSSINTKGAYTLEMGIKALETRFGVTLVNTAPTETPLEASKVVKTQEKETA